MIGDPCVIVRCDGAASAPEGSEPCRNSTAVFVRVPLPPPQVRAYVQAMLHDWLFVNDRDRCPTCRALDLTAARALAASRPSPR